MHLLLPLTPPPHPWCLDRLQAVVSARTPVGHGAPAAGEQGNQPGPAHLHVRHVVTSISRIPTRLATLTVLPRQYDTAAIARICAMCTCLTRLTLKTNSAPDDPLWAPLLRACAVHLESLSLQRTIPIGPIISPLDTTSLALPRLRSLTFSGQSYDWMTEFAQPWFAPIWMQLTHFSCDKVIALPRPEAWRIPPSHSLQDLSFSSRKCVSLG